MSKRAKIAHEDLLTILPTDCLGVISSFLNAKHFLAFVSTCRKLYTEILPVHIGRYRLFITPLTKFSFLELIKRARCFRAQDAPPFVEELILDSGEDEQDPNSDLPLDTDAEDTPPWNFTSEEPVWPKTLKYLQLHELYYAPLNSLPEGLEELHADEGDIHALTVPPAMKKLYLPDNWMYIDAVELPSGLETLSFRIVWYQHELLPPETKRITLTRREKSDVLSRFSQWFLGAEAHYEQ